MKVKDGDIIIMVETYYNPINNYNKYIQYQTCGLIHNNPVHKTTKLFIDFRNDFDTSVYTYKTRTLNKMLTNVVNDSRVKILIRWEK